LSKIPDYFEFGIGSATGRTVPSVAALQQPWVDALIGLKISTAIEPPQKTKRSQTTRNKKLFTN